MDASDPQPDSAPAQPTDDSPDGQSTDSLHRRMPVSRRAVLATLVGLGGLGVVSSSAQASHGGPHWRQDVAADGRQLLTSGHWKCRTIKPRFAISRAGISRSVMVC